MHDRILNKRSVSTTLSEVKQRQEAVFRALDSITVSGYRNVLNLAASMQIIDELIHTDIQEDSETEQK